MSWRTVVISNRCKLDYSMNYMVVRGKETQRILLDEIAILILENNAISITGCLMSALVEKKIKVVFCDGKHNPQSELLPYYGAHNDALKIRQQIAWTDEAKQTVWTSIVIEKIRNQAWHLDKVGKTDEAKMLATYATEVRPNDVTNREGHAAKVYFNALFGIDFTRNDEENVINMALNYGYSLLLSAFNREIVANGYLTQLGLSHENQFNHFNLSCDLMEPFRILVDDKVRQENFTDFGAEEKRTLVSVLHQYYTVRESEQTLLNAIRIYTKSVFDALCDEDRSKICFITL